MTLHVVPVGTSLLQKLNDGVVNGRVKHALLAQALAGELSAATNEHGVLDLAAALTSDQELSAEILDLLRDAQASGCAEWSGLAKSGVEGVGDDAMVFVASDTNDGLRAAMLVAARYAHRDGVAVRYVHDPATGLPSVLRQRQILVVRVPRLNLAPDAVNRPNENTWGSLGKLGAVLAHTASQRNLDVVFHLSGGYKALLPHLLVVAEGVQSVLVERRRDPTVRVRASCLYERGEEPVPLPIRWLTGRPLRLTHRMAYAAGANGELDTDEFDDLTGSYLDGDDSRPRKLTPAGLIITRTLWTLGDPR
ncbi:MAG: hypothetical protein ACRDQ5_15775 [Sciscionella sp.]